MRTYAVQFTGHGIGAIAVLGVGGECSAGVIAGMVNSARAKNLRVGQVAHCHLLGKESLQGGREVLDDALVVRTGEERYELHLHGGVAVVEAVLQALRDEGVEMLSAQQAGVYEVFGNGLAGVLALALPKALTMTGVRLLIAQKQQGLTAWAGRWKAWLQSMASKNELWQLHSDAQWLLARSHALSRLLDPPRVAIIGPPNAGKSTLANALLGRPLSITSEQAGTTRDWVDALTIFTTGGGEHGQPRIEVPVILVDTAGIRETPDPLELQSIARTHQQARAADAIILLLDATHWSVRDAEAMEQYSDRPWMVALNKIDLLAEVPAPRECPSHAVAISAKDQRGLPLLMTRLLAQLDVQAVGEQEPFAFTARQRAILTELAVAEVPATCGALLTALIASE